MKFKVLTYLLTLIVLIISCENIDKNSKKNFYINTNTKNIKIGFNNQSFTWLIKDETLNFPFNDKVNNIKLISKVDSIDFKLSPGQKVSVDFIINKIDTINAIIYGASKPVVFDSKYIRENSGTYKNYVPKVHELVNIAFALTEIGAKDHNMINHKTDYYHKVIKYFKPFKNHVLIDSLNRNMEDDPYAYYYNLRMNACMYSFDSKGEIVNQSPYNRFSWSSINHLEELLYLVKDFSETSKFEDFYEKNEIYYDSLKQVQDKVAPIGKMWKWIEDRFSERYNSYKVYFSPLIGGLHSTQYYTDNDYKEAIMFINAPIFENNVSSIKKEIRSSRIVFTEIDHNYVNPISDLLSNEIENSFNNRFYWVLDDPGLNGYSTPYAIFNEYMTWSLYSLYLLDNFNEDELEEAVKEIEIIMIKKRGFIKFKEFNQKLIELYQNNKQSDIKSLMESILKWSKNQQNTI
ncbi:DUF4932 domain-containing protein [Polaribacter porphyrae]|uniref:DUF4932 domain-containing protein n=1 Tax=Polaribacter porphyrae TaxID=1137780 RepID=A0A2S7WNC5_9FLAO|nr:DUF4932 domain-containing protein [Polaribacter porphyrae]PQJ79093.1 hypothetical protein BTO18_07885 [Polaribacter porphyrae]